MQLKMVPKIHGAKVKEIWGESEKPTIIARQYNIFLSKWWTEKDPPPKKGIVKTWKYHQPTWPNSYPLTTPPGNSNTHSSPVQVKHGPKKIIK